MAITKCTECDEDVSSHAIICPACGFPFPPKETLGYKKAIHNLKVYETLPFWASLKPIGLGFALGIVLAVGAGVLGEKDGYFTAAGLLVSLLSITLLPIIIAIKRRRWIKQAGLLDLSLKDFASHDSLPLPERSNSP